VLLFTARRIPYRDKTMSSFKAKRGRNTRNLCGILSSCLPLIVAFFLLSLSAKTTLAQDWVVTGTQVVENENILLNGNLIVENGGDLTLGGITLTMNNSYNGEYSILVKSGGAINIKDGTVITAASNSAHFAFEVEAGSQFLMQDSELHRCGWGTPYVSPMDETAGLSIFADNPIIQNNLFSENYVGIRLCQASGGTITNNRLPGNIWSSIDLQDWTEVVITDNTLSDSINGLYITQGSGHVIIRNHFSGHFGEGAMWMFNGWDNEFSSNQVEGPGIILCERSGNNRILNNTFNNSSGVSLLQSVNNLVKGNTITDAPEWAIQLQYASSNIVANNTLINTGRDGAIHLYHASENVLVNNIINNEGKEQGSVLRGILIWGGSSSNTVQSNHILSAYRGIALHYSANENKIISNDISFCEQQSIIVERSSNNNIHQNNFVDCGTPPYDDTGENTWDNGSTGNYWSDYSGNGSTSYEIPPLGLDNHPLLAPTSIEPVSVPDFSPIPQPPSPWKQALCISEPTVIMNQTLLLDRALVIEAGGTLTLRNVTVDMTSDIPAIIVQPLGALYIYQSKIGPTNPENGGYLFWAMPESIFVMKHTEVHGAGLWPGSGDWAGLYVGTTNAIIENNVIRDCQSGIGLDNAEGAYIVGNTVTQCGFCITLNNAGNGNAVTSNRVSQCLTYGVNITGANTSTIAHNQVSSIWENAMNLHITKSNIRYNRVLDSQDGVLLTGSHNTIEGNEISDIWRFTFPVNEAYKNTFVDNNIANCRQGLGFADSTGDNILYHNNFMNITTWSIDEGTNNQWDNGSQGNHWSDYTGADANCDGIGDIPYHIGPNGVDRYPLMAPFLNVRPCKAMPWITLLLLNN